MINIHFLKKIVVKGSSVYGAFEMQNDISKFAHSYLYLNGPYLLSPLYPYH